MKISLTLIAAMVVIEISCTQQKRAAILAFKLSIIVLGFVMSCLWSAILPSHAHLCKLATRYVALWWVEWSWSILWLPVSFLIRVLSQTVPVLQVLHSMLVYPLGHGGTADQSVCTDSTVLIFKNAILLMIVGCTDAVLFLYPAHLRL